MSDLTFIHFCCWIYIRVHWTHPYQKQFQ